MKCALSLSGLTQLDKNLQNAVSMRTDPRYSEYVIDKTSWLCMSCARLFMSFSVNQPRPHCANVIRVLSTSVLYIITHTYGEYLGYYVVLLNYPLLNWLNSHFGEGTLWFALAVWTTHIILKNSIDIWNNIDNASLSKIHNIKTCLLTTREKHYRYLHI